MLKITSIRIENSEQETVTDNPKPRFSFSLESDRSGCSLASARFLVSDAETVVWDSGEKTDGKQISVIYEGRALKPFTAYTVKVWAKDDAGETAEKETSFSSGRMGTPWQAKWITDTSLSVPEKSSPGPLQFAKKFTVRKDVKKAWINATALGIYDLYVNGIKAGDRYFAPGFTSYEHQIQYQTYPLTALNHAENEIRVIAAPGWAAGAFTFTRTNRTYTDTQCLLAELHILYEDGTKEVIATDESWQVSQEGKLRFADWYDGEIYDASFDESKIRWKNADIVSPRKEPMILAEYGAPVRVLTELKPAAVTTSPDGERIYDFGQNFYGVIKAKINGREGQQITVRHAEVLQNGTLFTKPLRTARAMITYICKEGLQTYSPSFTGMGFRYAGVKGIREEDIELSALVLTSAIEKTGSFHCSDERLNQLQHNIEWGGISNFADIPTDCPQRDERMGWTGDIAVFAATAAFNFDMSRFLEKWLKDLSSEQEETGELPMTCPKAEDSWKKRVTGCWGDACVLVPYAEYMARGDEELLRSCYPMMKKFLTRCEERAAMFSVGKHKRIWSLPFQFGDWCAPDEDYVRWIMKGKWVATAYFANSCRIFSRIAEILDEPDDAKKYKTLYEEISDAYTSLLCSKDGKLKKEFQTGYVLPLAFEMAHGSMEQGMADHLEKLVEDAGYAPRTGFPGTPYLLFALHDHGKADTALRTLFNEELPGWLYAVRAGATTIWERWDALKPDGTVNMGEHDKNGGMVSFNHYANGAVGDFLYRRIAGLEALEAGYRKFIFKPLACRKLSFASAEVNSPYGKVKTEWIKEKDEFIMNVRVPVSAECLLITPAGNTYEFRSGIHTVREKIKGEDA